MSGIFSSDGARGMLDTGVEGVELGVYFFSR